MNDRVEEIHYSTPTPPNTPKIKNKLNGTHTKMTVSSNNTIPASPNLHKKRNSVTAIMALAMGRSPSPGNSSGSDDGASTLASATALRRLYFKSGRHAKHKNILTSTFTNPPPPTNVPKVVVMGSSSVSTVETTINTSTDSASTLVTSVTSSENCDSLDMGDISGQSEPLLSSLDEPSNTEIHNCSENDVTEIELTSSRPNVNLLDTLENDDMESSLCIQLNQPRTAPCKTEAYFKFDRPASPKSVKTVKKNQNFFTFHDVGNGDDGDGARTPPNNHVDRLNNRKDANGEKENCHSSQTSIISNSKYDKKDLALFPFDREAIDYERIQRECLVVESDEDITEKNTIMSSKYSCVYNDGNGSSTTLSSTASDSDQNESVFENNIHESLISSSSNNQNVIENENANIYVQYSKFAKKECKVKADQISTKRIKRSTTDHMSMTKMPVATAPATAAPNQKQFEEIENNKSKNCAGILTDNGSTLNAINNELLDFRVDLLTSTDQQQHFSSSTMSTTQKTSRNKSKMNNQNHYRRSHSHKSKNRYTHHNTEQSSSQNQPHDKLDHCQRKSTSSTSSTSSGGGGSGCGGINVISNPLEAAVCTQPRTTIVVQQPSLSLDSTTETLLLKDFNECVELGRRKNSHIKTDNMRQLLDVTNTITLDDIRNFEMKYGSPHHNRSQSVKAPGTRSSGRPNQLSLPQQRSRVASMPNTGVEEEYYRLRHFSITGKGVINRGDSVKSRNSRSNISVASSNSSNEHLTTQVPVVSSNTNKSSRNCSLASSRESSTSNPGSTYKVLMLGGSAVGKSSLVCQFLTSEYLHAYDTSIDDDSGEKSVNVLLSGEESELTFIDHSTMEMTFENCLNSYDPHGYCVIYSSADRTSFVLAERILQALWTSENIAQKAVILVGNKADLARSRVVRSDEGKSMATAYDCKFIETSVGINHNVDELLVGLLSQIRLKLENPQKTREIFRKRSLRKSKRRACSPLGSTCLAGNAGTNPSTPTAPPVISDLNTPPGSAQSSPRKYRGSRTSASLKVKGLLGRVWARDSKSKSCENLHVL